jgi:hypothetical protein
MYAKDCTECGFLYCPSLAGDRRLHNKHHRAAIAARDALMGEGPCPLPLGNPARERLKRQAGVEKTYIEMQCTMWGHFARSLESWGYDISKHATWPVYAAAYIANGTGPPGWQPALTELAATYGSNPDRRLRPGFSYWEVLN